MGANVIPMLEQAMDLILSRLHLNGFVGQVWLRHARPESKVDEGKSKVQAEEQETMTNESMEFTALNLTVHDCWEFPGDPAGQDFAVKLALVILDEPIQR
jgi:hypothetical protein